MTSLRPYLVAWRRQRRNKRKVEGWFPPTIRALLLITAAVVLLPLIQPVFLGFLDRDPAGWADGLEAVSLRAGLLLVAVLSLDVYTALIRGTDRQMLAVLPVEPGAVAWLTVLRLAVERAWLPLVLIWLLSPIAWRGHLGMWAGASAVVLGSYFVGLTSAAVMHLLAVEVAESEFWAPVLDMGRGSNPRAQAAFIYAPGLVLMLSGTLVGAASNAARAAADGSAVSSSLLVAPFVGAAIAAFGISPLARRAWFRATAVIAEIDARYAATESREESLRVYLEWAIRFLPRRDGLFALKDLRCGWRVRRPWITGAWVAGAGAGLAAWSANPAAPGHATAVMCAGAWGALTIGAVMERDEPLFMRQWLPEAGSEQLAARWLVLFGWGQGAVWLGVFAIAIRHGVLSALTSLGIAELAICVAATVAVACARIGHRSIALYAPVAAVAAAASAAFVMATL